MGMFAHLYICSDFEKLVSCLTAYSVSSLNKDDLNRLDVN